MDDKSCPRCEAEILNETLYKCVRCFSVYCAQCAGSDGGKLCPKCGMSQRMVLSVNKKGK